MQNLPSIALFPRFLPPEDRLDPNNICKSLWILLYPLQVHILPRVLNKSFTFIPILDSDALHHLILLHLFQLLLNHFLLSILFEIALNLFNFIQNSLILLYLIQIHRIFNLFPYRSPFQKSLYQFNSIHKLLISFSSAYKLLIHLFLLL